MRPLLWRLAVLSLLLLPGTGCQRSQPAPAPVTSKLTTIQLGSEIFFDPRLSTPPGRSCASCHDPSVAFSDPEHAAISRGARPGTRGERHSMRLTYVSFWPQATTLPKDFKGGFFWDAHAATLAEQPRGPLLNPNEMGNDSEQAIADKLRVAPYAADLQARFGPHVFDQPASAVNAACSALSDFESSARFHPFSSRYDDWRRGKGLLTDAEKRGLALFDGKARCAACHTSKSNHGAPPLFTNFGYNNIGVPATAGAPPDPGLEAVTHRPVDRGAFKTPSLRNVALSAPYFHNGSVKTLEDVVHFYNVGADGSFGPTDYPATVNREQGVGNLGLSARDEADLVAFLRALTDRPKDP